MKIAVLMGGNSFEREFSLESGKQVCSALEEAGHKVVPLDTTKDLVPTLRSERPQVCYSALHGKHGEDGTIQSLLEFLEIPFVGSSSSVSRETWNKATLPATMERYHALTDDELAMSWPFGFCISRDAFKDMGAATALDLIAQRIPGGFPLCVKPACGGSAMGVHKVGRQEDLAVAIMDALTYDSEVLIQQWIDGVEVAVSIIGEGEEAHVLPPVEIVPEEGMFTTEVRMTPGAVRYYAPVRLESLHPHEAKAQSIRAEIERAALEVYQAYGCRDLGRVDLVWDGAQARVLEINVSPGMSTHSLFPAACAASGLSLPGVLDRLVGRYA